MCSQPQYKEPGAAIRGNTGHGCCCEGTSGRWVALSALILGAIREHSPSVRNITVPLIHWRLLQCAAIRSITGAAPPIRNITVPFKGPLKCATIRNITVPLIHWGGYYNAPLLEALQESSSSIRNITVTLMGGGGNYSAPLLGALWEQNSSIRSILAPLMG